VESRAVEAVLTAGRAHAYTGLVTSWAHRVTIAATAFALSGLPAMVAACPAMDGGPSCSDRAVVHLAAACVDCCPDVPVTFGAGPRVARTDASMLGVAPPLTPTRWFLAPTTVRTAVASSLTVSPPLPTRAPLPLRI
jgi:hypothetical protein